MSLEENNVRALLALLSLLRIRGIPSILLKLPQYLRLSWRLMWDVRAPVWPKIWVILAVFYGLSPIDLIPDLLVPLIGYGEDLVLIILSLRNLIQNSPTELVTELAQDISQKK